MVMPALKLLPCNALGDNADFCFTDGVELVVSGGCNKLRQFEHGGINNQAFQPVYFVLIRTLCKKLREPPLSTSMHGEAVIRFPSIAPLSIYPC